MKSIYSFLAWVEKMMEAYWIRLRSNIAIHFL